METIKKMIKDKGLSDIFLALSLISSIIALIMYYQSGITDFTISLSSAVTGSLIAIIVLSVIFLVFSSKIGKYLTFVLWIFAFVSYISNQVNYIANVFVAIDGSSFSGGFICCMIFFIVGIASSLVSGILAKDEIKEIIDIKKGDQHE